MNPAILEATRLWTLAVPTVSAYIAAGVRDFQSRDDVLQDTAVAVLESFVRFDASQSFVSWALGIARNQVLLHWRRQKRNRLIFDTETLEVLTRTFANSSSAAELQKLNYLGACVESLDAPSRKLCQLRYEQDMKPSAIAARTGQEANTVAKSLQRIRDRLRQCIERKAAAEAAS